MNFCEKDITFILISYFFGTKSVKFPDKRSDD